MTYIVYKLSDSAVVAEPMNCPISKAKKRFRAIYPRAEIIDIFEI